MLVVTWSGAGGASAHGATGPGQAAGPRPQATVAAQAFSPNGDGDSDIGVIRFTVPHWSDGVDLTIRRPDDKAVRTVRLGRVSKGSHTWAWDGRDDRGRKAPDGTYDVRVHATDSRWLDGRDRIVVDLGVDLALHAPLFGLPEGSPAAVYPRTTQLRDAVPLTVSHERNMRRVVLTISDPSGRVVLRRVEHPSEASFTHDWTARSHGKPLPAGRYRAVARGVDRVGNAGRTPALRLWVSRERLTWQEKAIDVLPSVSNVDLCRFGGGNDCGAPQYRPCGEIVPSAIFDGGLTYRSRECSADPTDSHALGQNHLPVPEASARGVASAKVAFTGRPTVAGGDDLGTVSLAEDRDDYLGPPPVQATGSTGAETAWVDEPYGHDAFVTQFEEWVPPGVIWWFETTGTDSIDVARFTVTVRYLAVAE
ncbi:hypothetical protein ASG76_01540 [Nocardioides sp. Soil774]|nr:hypothetical protein ASG76_01540 [Nocardioides sp. Soil774]